MLCQNLGGVHVGANTYRACIHSCTNSGKIRASYLCIGFVPRVTLRSLSGESAKLTDAELELSEKELNMQMQIPDYKTAEESIRIA